MSHEIFGADKVLKKNKLISEGLTNDELTKPLVLILCENGCEDALTHIKHGILKGGCAALSVSMPALHGEIAEGSSKGSMLFLRESIADMTEGLLNIYSADGVAIVASSSAATAGMIMGAVRRNTPLAFLPAFFKGCYYPSRLINTRALVNSGKVGITTLESVECSYSHGRTLEMDSCNSLCIFLEGCGISAIDSVGAFSKNEQIIAARSVGELCASRTLNLNYPRKDLTLASVDCGLAAFIAAGGISAALIDILAIANENLLSVDLKHVENLSSKLYRLCAISPFGRFNIVDFTKAGGVLAILKEINKLPKLLSSTLKINGVLLSDLIEKTEINTSLTHSFGTEDISYQIKGVGNNDDNNLGDFLDNAICALSGFDFVLDSPILRLEKPVCEGGFGILKGNLMDYGVFNRSINEKQVKSTAVVFDSEQQFKASLQNGFVAKGSVVVVRGQGAKASGMPMLDLQSSILAANVEDIVVVTDGRVYESGGCVQISMCCGEVLQIVKTGDPIEIDFKKCKINLNLPSKEINGRLKKLKNIDESLSGGLLKYSYLVDGADNGCILKQKF